MITKKNHLSWLRTVAYLLLALIALPQMAFASSDVVTTVVYNFCDWLSGPLAAAIAILGCIGVGYACFIGHISKEKFFYMLLGLGFIIGGSYFAKSILLNGVL